MTLVRYVLLLVLALVAGTAGAQTFPKFTGFVVDAANVLPPQVEQDLSAKLSALQRDTKRQLVVATIPDLQGYPIEEYGYRLGRAWGVGLRDVKNGAILFIAPNEPTGHRGPRIEVGTGLEGVLTDAFAGQVIRQEMVPRLRAGDKAGAMTAGTDALIAQLRANPDEAAARSAAAAAEVDREYRGQARQGGGSSGIPISLIFWAVIFLFVILPLLRGRRGGRLRGRRYHGGGSNLPIILWTIGNEMARSRSSGWSGGGIWSGGGESSQPSWSSGDFMGGGGGSFSGGGATGDW